jgi:hypothetical protein
MHMTTREKAALLALTIASTFAACVPTRDDLVALAEEASACEPGDTCVLAGGGSQCTCDVPVNATRAREVDLLAERVSCGATMVECVSFTNLRCEDGRCTADNR